MKSTNAGLGKNVRLSRMLRVTVPAVLLVYLGCNAMSRMASPGYWLAHPDGLVASRSNTAVAYDLEALQDWLDTRSAVAGKQVAFVSTHSYNDGPPQPLQVLAGQSMSLLASHDVDCVNCVSSPTLLDFRWFSPLTADVAARADYQLRIGPSPPRCIDGFARRVVSDNLAFYERAALAHNDRCNALHVN